MKTLIVSLIFLCQIARAATAQVYVQCFDGNYRMTVDGSIEIHDQVSGGTNTKLWRNLKFKTRYSIKLHTGYRDLLGMIKISILKHLGSLGAISGNPKEQMDLKFYWEIHLLSDLRYHMAWLLNLDLESSK
jgi:hypothetical protein